MVNKAKKTNKSSSAKASDSNVVRIKASSAPTKKKVESEAKVTKVVASAKTDKVKAVKAQKVKKPKSSRGIRGAGVFGAIGGYFKGAWTELRQVRWPNRRATWGLTGAVLVYSAFFIVLILLLDAGFKYMFELILGK